MNLLERLRKRMERVDSVNGQYPVEVRVFELRALLAVVEAAQSVHASLRREFSHSLAMRDLGKALRAVRSTAEEEEAGA